MLMATAVAKAIAVTYRGSCHFNTIDRDRSQMAAYNLRMFKPNVGKDVMAIARVAIAVVMTRASSMAWKRT